MTMMSMVGGSYMNYTEEGYVTHDQVEAMTMGERVGVLNKAEFPIN